MPTFLKDVPLQTKEEINLPFTFKYTELGSSILKGFQEQRQDDFLLDVTLKCGPIAIRAHKAFVAAFAAYFRALFKFEPSRTEFELHDIDGQSLALLIDYAYSGELVITVENVQDILQTANFINHDPVCDACCAYLKKNLCPESCFDIMQLAVSLGRTKLQSDAKLYALEHFEEISKSDQFLAISAELLKEYLKDDGLVVCENGFVTVPARQDELVKGAVEKYVASDVENRNGLLAELLSLAEHSTEGRFRTLPGLQHKDSVRMADHFQVVSESKAETFNDIELVTRQEVLFITGMKIYMRRWDGRPVVGGMLVYYSNGASILHGGDDFGHETYEFRINPDARIVQAKFFSGWMIDNMSFTTNTGRLFGPFGGPGGSERDLTPPAHVTGAYLAGFVGGVDVTQSLPAVRRLALTWGYYHKEEDKADTVAPSDDDDYPNDYDNYDVYDDYDGDDYYGGDDGHDDYHTDEGDDEQEHDVHDIYDLY